ncbi:hypothetical protein BKA62DRAFT_770444 [Auriculariales sp. MPI-PUGE-AT-0066]|nr:hypothetical protein BKA62DRAFT_770444 [Auriculariales sp. MPI-PUGE-AT-0066]
MSPQGSPSNDPLTTSLAGTSSGTVDTTPTSTWLPSLGTSTSLTGIPTSNANSSDWSFKKDERGNVWESRGNMTLLSDAEAFLRHACPSQTAPQGASSRQLLVLWQAEAWITLNTSSDFTLSLWSPTNDTFYVNAAAERWNVTTTLPTSTDESNPCPRQYNRTSLGIDSYLARLSNLNGSYESDPMQNLTVGTTAGSELYIFNLTLFDTSGTMLPTSSSSIAPPHESLPAHALGTGSGFQLALVAVPLGIALALLLGLLALCYERQRRRTTASIFYSRTGPHSDTNTWRVSGTSRGSIASSLSPLSASFEKTRTSDMLVTQHRGPHFPPATVLFSPLSSATPNSAHPLLEGYNVDPFADSVAQPRRMSQTSMISSGNRSSIVILHQPEIATLRRASSSSVQPHALDTYSLNA